MTAEAMHPVDAAWYHLDGPTNPAVVTALLTTRKPLDFAKVRDVFAHRIATIDRYRRRVVERGLPLPTPHWEDADDFDLDQHLHHVALPSPGDDAALAALVQDLASQPLPRDLPLWQAHVIDGRASGGALVMRYHHCIGDGAAMMNVAQRLFDTTPHAQRHFEDDEMPVPSTTPPSMLGSAFGAIEHAMRDAGELGAQAWNAVLHPEHWAAAAGTLAQGAGALVKELLKPADPTSPFKGEFGMRQHVAWSAPIPIADLKAIGAPMNAKVNDVLGAALAGALRHYLQQHDHDSAHPTLRAMVPVNLRPPERAQALGNEFGLVILDLPIEETTPLRRLAASKARMDELKHSPEAVAMQFLFNVFGRGPKAIEDLAQTIFGSKASLVLTNVAGPREPLYLAGVPVERMMFWVPHPGQELGMGASFISYQGQASLGILSDARLVAHPREITDAFEQEIAGMLAHLRRGEAKLQDVKRKATARS